MVKINTWPNYVKFSHEKIYSRELMQQSRWTGSLDWQTRGFAYLGYWRVFPKIKCADSSYLIQTQGPLAPKMLPHPAESLRQPEMISTLLNTYKNHHLHPHPLSHWHHCTHNWETKCEITLDIWHIYGWLSYSILFCYIEVVLAVLQMIWTCIPSK